VFGVPWKEGKKMVGPGGRFSNFSASAKCLGVDLPAFYGLNVVVSPVNALSNSLWTDGWTLGIEGFPNSIPAGIVDEPAQSLGRRMG
jgi:hypothetical protein